MKRVNTAARILIQEKDATVRKKVKKMLKLQERIEIKRRHDKKQAIMNLVEYTVAMMIIILFCSINDQNCTACGRLASTIFPQDSAAGYSSSNACAASRSRAGSSKITAPS